MEYQYFPGCSLHGIAQDYAKSLHAIGRPLGLVLRELEGWNCCGATAARSLDDSLALFLAARNLALAQAKGQQLLVPCNLCFSNLATATRALGDENARRSVGPALRSCGLTYDGQVTVVHPLQAVVADVGLKRIKSQVARPLTGLKVVSYYGCLLTRPRAVALPESDCSPRWLDQMATAVGATPLPFSAKTRCCGGPLLTTHPEAARLAAKPLLDEARDLGAQCIAVTCPQCHLVLAGTQRAIQRRHGVKYGIPVVYFTQLLGLALGMGPGTLGVPPRVAAAVTGTH